MSKEINKNQDFENILVLILQARNRVYAKANSELVLLYFNVGSIVYEKVSLGNWGDNTVQELADFIQSKLPNLTGFNRRGLYRMRQFYELHHQDSAVFNLWLNIVSPTATLFKYADNQLFEKVSSLATQSEKHKFYLENLLIKLSWTNHLEIFSSIKKPEEILFYCMYCLKEKWTKAELRRQIKTATFERSLLAKNQLSSEVSTKTLLPQMLFKDPYIFEFLNLPDGHSEKDFEKAITFNLQKFILEVGKGFTYLGSQYRIQVGNKDYYTDLLFYHRDLQCLVLFELKIEEFEPEFLGKLNFYLEALDREVKRPNENPSIGILLCKGKDTEVVEYAMARNTSPALIAEYETKLINKKLLADKLNQLAEVLNNIN